MGNIRLLSDVLASQVAAGEVVERPASVVKELIENSIDAGAKNIELRIQRGGVSCIQVTDDGCGMDRNDALLCIERHATSKLRTSDDLGRIATMGFRGEALPSIASVSRFRLSTREKEALAGTEVIINGGKLVEVKDAGDAPGTQIEARSLFFNIPARRKFLRSENTEFSHIEQQVRVHAIAHPGIRFTLSHNDRVIFHLPATTSLLERIRGLIGAELGSRLLELPAQQREGIGIHGFIGEPGLSRSDRSLQLTFLNRRPIEGAVLHHALREGYHTALMKGQYPITFLFVEMDPSLVDVNVHPAKREVRFHDGARVRAAVVRAIAETLERRNAPTKPAFQPKQESANPLPSLAQTELLPRPEQHALSMDRFALAPEIEMAANPKSASKAQARPWNEEADEEPSQGEPSLASVESEDAAPEIEVGPSPTPKRAGVPEPGDFRIIGVLSRLYLLMESKDGLVLMDQHAAHERVLFEQMRKRMETGGVPVQALLLPITLELTPREYDLMTENLATLKKLGIGAEPFGGNTLMIDGLPAFIHHDDSNRFINAIIEELRKDTQRMSSMRLGEDMVATTVCRHAVKARDPLHPQELERLLADLLACDLPFCCPHGRPTLVQISHREIERKFGRITS